MQVQPIREHRPVGFAQCRCRFMNSFLAHHGGHRFAKARRSSERDRQTDRRTPAFRPRSGVGYRMVQDTRENTHPQVAFRAAACCPQQARHAAPVGNLVEDQPNRKRRTLEYGTIQVCAPMAEFEPGGKLA